MSSQFLKLPLSGGGGGGAASWGSITGTLSSQSDLQTALNNKLSLSGGTMSGNVSMESSGTGTATVFGIFGGSSGGVSTYNFAPTPPVTMSVPIQVKDGADVLLGTIVYNPALPGVEYVPVAGSALPAVTNIGGLPLFALSTGTNLIFLSISFSDTYAPMIPLKVSFSAVSTVNSKVTGLADGVSPRDAVNKQQLDLAIGSLANNTLSNLTTTSINQDLVPNIFDPMTMTGRNIGSTSFPWLNGYFAFVTAAMLNNVPSTNLIISATTADVVVNTRNIDASASTGYFRLPVLPVDPASPVDGAIWYNSGTNTLRARINGVTVNL